MNTNHLTDHPDFRTTPYWWEAAPPDAADNQDPPGETDVDPHTRARLLHRAMSDRFPQLAEVKVTHSWTGYVAFTYDSVPHVGIDRGMHYALGCNGSGVAMMTYLGNLIAKRILRANEIDSAYIGLEHPAIPVPGYQGNPWFLPVIGGWYRFLDRLDRRFA